MDFNGKTTVFVYGTLMKGFGNERVIIAFPHKNYEAVINDMELYDVGHYPAMVKGSNSYKGELLVFDDDISTDSLFLAMDRLEGYYIDNPRRSLYVRENVTVFVNGEPVNTQVYLWNLPIDKLVYIDPEKYSGYKDYLNKKQRFGIA